MTDEIIDFDKVRRADVERRKREQHDGNPFGFDAEMVAMLEKHSKSPHGRMRKMERDQEDRIDFLRSLSDKLGGKLRFTPIESFTAETLNGTADRMHLGEGFLVAVDSPKPTSWRRLFKSGDEPTPVSHPENIRLQNALKIALSSMGNSASAYVYRTQFGVWIGQGAVDEMIERAKPYVDEKFLPPSIEHLFGNAGYGDVLRRLVTQTDLGR